MSRVIRKLTINDYEDIVRLWADSGLPFKPRGRDSRGMMAKEMALDGVAYLGLYEDGRMLGVGIASYDGRRGWLNRVAVDPDRRGEGLAAEILAECEKFLRSKGAVVLTALIEDVNYPSISCFQKAGFICDKKWLYFSKRDSNES